MAGQFQLSGFKAVFWAGLLADVGSTAAGHLGVLGELSGC